MAEIEQIVLTGKEFKDYKIYKENLKKNGVNSFKLLKELENDVKLINSIKKAQWERVRLDGAHIIGGAQIHLLEDFIKFYDRCFTKSIQLYATNQQIEDTLTREQKDFLISHLYNINPDIDLKRMFNEELTNQLNEHLKRNKIEPINKTRLSNSFWDKLFNKLKPKD